MIYFSICLTLLTLIAAFHLLAKAQKEQWGSLYKWVSYFIISVAAVILVCQSVQGIMCCHKGKWNRTEQCCGGMDKDDKDCKMEKGCYKDEKECCETKGDHKMMKGKADSASADESMKMDSGEKK